MKPRKGAKKLKVTHALAPVIHVVELKEPTAKGFILHKVQIVTMNGMTLQMVISESTEYRLVRKRAGK